MHVWENVQFHIILDHYSYHICVQKLEMLEQTMNTKINLKMDLAKEVYWGPNATIR